MRNVKNFFDRNGYVIFRNLIANNCIDKICDEFTKFKLRNSIYYSQSEHNWRNTSSDLDEFNNLNCSIENFTELLWAPKLAKAGDILASEGIKMFTKYIWKRSKIYNWNN